MDSNISELVKLGHERADELKAACGAIDVRSVAQLISDLATQLDVQLARSNALAAENAGLNKFIKADCWVWDDKNEEYIDAVDCMPETPATDAFLAEVRASAIEHAASERWGSGYVFDELNEFAAQLRKGVQS